VTTVIGIARPHGVWMSADTGTNVFDRPVVGSTWKIRRLLDGGGSPVALLGISGTAAAISVLRKAFADEPVDQLGDGDPEDWSYAIASRMTKAMVEAGLTDHDTGQMDGTMLLGTPGHMWTLEHHLAIRMPDGIGAVGSGEAVAIGALDVLLEDDVPLSQAVYRAATIAINRDQWSRLPLQNDFLPAADSALRAAGLTIPTPAAGDTASGSAR